MTIRSTYCDKKISSNIKKSQNTMTRIVVHVDHPNKIKKCRVCIYYNESLPVRIISFPYLKEASLLQMTYNDRKIIVSAIYRSSSQSGSELDLFLSNFEKILSDICRRKPPLYVITGNFNAISCSC